MAEGNLLNDRQTQAVEHDDVYENRPIPQEDDMFIVDGLRAHYHRLLQNHGIQQNNAHERQVPSWFWLVVGIFIGFITAKRMTW